jgi:archaellum component FlaG (FlaF/FlaG flagellin family)
MTALVTNVVPNVGVADTGLYVNASAGDTAACGTGTFLVVKNTGGSAITVTITCPILVDGRLTTSSSVSPSIPATTGVAWLPLLPIYASATTGLATINYSVTGATTQVAVVRVP